MKIIHLKRNNDALMFLKNNLFKSKSLDKIESGVFTGPEIRKIIKNKKEFSKLLNRKEKNCFNSFINLVDLYFTKSPGSSEDILSAKNQLISSFESNLILLSPKLHYLMNHFDHFPPNYSHWGEEQGEHHHQEIKIYKSRYGKKVKPMIQDFCWSRIALRY